MGNGFRTFQMMLINNVNMKEKCKKKAKFSIVETVVPNKRKKTEQTERKR